MPFNAELTGSRWGPIQWPFTVRRILAYRAALAPDDRAGLDDATPEGLTALPQQIVSPEWVLALTARADPRQTLDEAEGRRAVHAGQDSRFHRPIRAGETLELAAELLGARQSRAGAVAAIRYTAREPDTGLLVAESLSTSVYRGAAIAGRASPEVPSPDYPPPGPDACRTPVRLNPGLPHIYSECAEIWNPIHTERRVALAAGLDDIIVHGTALWALAGLEATRLYASGDSRRLRRLAARFAAPALTGQTAVLEHDRHDGAVRFRLWSEDGLSLMTGRAEFS